MTANKRRGAIRNKINRFLKHSCNGTTHDAKYMHNKVNIEFPRGYADPIVAEVKGSH